jgi:hypothetical protein
MYALCTPLLRRLPLVARYILARGVSVEACTGEGASAVRAVRHVATRAILVNDFRGECLIVLVFSRGRAHAALMPVRGSSQFIDPPLEELEPGMARDHGFR